MAGSTAEHPTLPEPTRASDAERDEAVIQLKDEFVAGRLSQDTFLHRVNTALAARRRYELEPLLSDLPEPVYRPTLAARARALAAPVTDAIGEAVRGAVRAAQAGRSAVAAANGPTPLFFPPVGGRTVFTVGREDSCDLFLTDMTVSRIHARLTMTGGGWMLADFGSTNGTRVNGWRVREPVTIRPGDRVRFGRASFVMQDVP
jgi:hypothetical protein